MYALPSNLGVKSTVYAYCGYHFGCHSGTQNLNVEIIWWFRSTNISIFFEVHDNTLRCGCQNDTQILHYERGRSLSWNFAVLTWRFYHNFTINNDVYFFNYWSKGNFQAIRKKLCFFLNNSITYSEKIILFVLWLFDTRREFPVQEYIPEFEAINRQDLLDFQWREEDETWPTEER